MNQDKQMLTINVSKKQYEMLKKISELSMKPISVLVREAIDLLPRSYGKEQTK